MRLLRKLMQDSSSFTGRDIFYFLHAGNIYNSLIQCHFDYARSSWYSNLSKIFSKKVTNY